MISTEILIEKIRATVLALLPEAGLDMQYTDQGLDLGVSFAGSNKTYLYQLKSQTISLIRQVDSDTQEEIIMALMLDFKRDIKSRIERQHELNTLFGLAESSSLKI